jgi:hypothetical protein
MYYIELLKYMSAVRNPNLTPLALRIYFTGKVKVIALNFDVVIIQHIVQHFKYY